MRKIIALPCLLVCIAPAVVDADWTIGTEVELLRALELVEMRRLEEARNAFASLCPFGKDEVLRRRKAGDIACAVRMYVEVEIREPVLADPGDLYWLLGVRARKAQQHNLAYALLRIAAERKPEETTTWLELAHVYRDAGRFDKAEESLKRALEIAPDDRDVVYWLATIKMDQRQLADAEAQLMRVLEIDPGHARVWFRLGEIRLLQERPREALELFQKAKVLGVDKKPVRAKIKECKRRLR